MSYQNHSVNDQVLVEEQQKDTNKKKKCRGNRKEQHRRRRLRRQQQKLENTAVDNNPIQNGEDVMTGNNHLHITQRSSLSLQVCYL